MSPQSEPAMRPKYFLILGILLFSLPVFSEEVEILNDLSGVLQKESKSITSEVKALSEKVNHKIHVVTVVKNNSYHSNEIDLNYFKSLKELKTLDQYISSSTNGILIEVSFVQNTNKQWEVTPYFYSSSKKILPRICDYLETRFTTKCQKGNYKSIFDANVKESLSLALQTIDKIFQDKWLENLHANADKYLLMKKYQRDYSGWDGMTFYEFYPHLNTKDNESVVGKNKITTSDFIFFQKKDNTLVTYNDNLLNSQYNKNDSYQIARYTNLITVKKEFESYSFHSDSLKVSDWPISNSNNYRINPKPDTSLFHKKDKGKCRLIMKEEVLGPAGSWMPVMAWRQNYGVWKATRCNMFAFHLAQACLPNRMTPWKSIDINANVLHATYLNSDKNFIQLFDVNEAWVYAAAGYPVFATSPPPKGGSAGHIGIVWDEKDGKDVQAVQVGNTAGKGKIDKVFGGALGREEMKFFLFIGHFNT